MAKKKPRPESPRARRRTLQRAEQGLSRDRERLFALEAGGSTVRPIEVPSASVVEAHAVGVPCPQCEGEHELLEHVALVAGSVRLREARLRCRQCGTLRSLFFRILEPKPN